MFSFPQQQQYPPTVAMGHQPVGNTMPQDGQQVAGLPLNPDSAEVTQQTQRRVDDSYFTKRIEEVLRQQSLREEQSAMRGNADEKGEEGPFTSGELHELSLLCTQQQTASVGGFASVEGDLLPDLVPLLNQHVQRAGNSDFFKEAGSSYKKTLQIDTVKQVRKRRSCH